MWELSLFCSYLSVFPIVSRSQVLTQSLRFFRFLHFHRHHRRGLLQWFLPRKSLTSNRDDCKIRSYVKCRVSEPILDGFHGLSVCKQKTGTTVSQIMEPQFPETIFPDHVLEMIADEVRRDQLTVCITAHKALIGSVKTGFQELGIHLLGRRSHYYGRDAQECPRSFRRNCCAGSSHLRRQTGCYYW